MFLLAQISVWHMVTEAQALPLMVMILLAIVSLLSWTVIFAKFQLFRKARSSNGAFLRAFRKSDTLLTLAASVQSFPLSPLVSVFEFGYEEVDRQIRSKGTLLNKLSVERALQLGVSEELAKLERHVNWLASTAAISPFIGLFGTVWGIIEAFSALGAAGGASLRAVGQPIAEALVTTALGLFAAIPAAVAYNYFSHQLREMGARMEDFSLEFLNLAERNHGD